MEPQTDTKRIVISIDAMGGDRGPAAVVDGIVESAEKNPDVSFLVHGNEAELKKLVARRKSLTARCEICATERVVTMDEKPSYVMRNGAGTSMWSAVDSVRNREAAAAVSCGNTGALMAVSMLRLRKLPGVNRPAIASVWPSRNPHEFNVMLDMGADIRADAEDLVQFAVMGASYARNALDLSEPRVGLLNVGTEENKGRAELKAAHELMETAAGISNFSYIGFVEGNDILGDRADVIVTDGFTGNVALKTAEGTAKLVADSLREAFQKTPLSRMAALLAMPSLKRFSRRMDPRRSNGGVFLGLNGMVVKSHGSADATAMAAAINLAIRLARAGFQDRLASRVATALSTLQSANLQTGSPAGPTNSGAAE